MSGDAVGMKIRVYIVDIIPTPFKLLLNLHKWTRTSNAMLSGIEGEIYLFKSKQLYLPTFQLNPDNNQCDSPSSIDVCQDPNSSTQLYRSKDPFNCAEQKDGLYEANPCSPGYIQCTQGRRFDQTCPNGLVFNSNAGVCDYASKCKKAKPKKRIVKKISL